MIDIGLLFREHLHR